MKIALHLGTLRGHGSATVGYNILRELVSQGQDHEFLVWVPAEWAKTYGIGPDSFGPNVKVLQTKPGILQKLVHENITMRLALRHFGANKLFSLGDTSLPLCSVSHLLLVQQAYLYLDPPDIDFQVDKTFRLKVRAMKAYFRATLPTVDCITVQSNTMAKELMGKYKIPEARIVVVPSAVCPIPLDESDESEADSAPSLCYVASAAPHKNHEIIADILHGLRERVPCLRVKLTVSSNSVPALVRRATAKGVIDAIDFMGSISSREVVGLMKQSVVVLMPSKLESFGLPYYEAMALGMPMVVADKPIAREACVDGAFYADASDSDAWVNQVSLLLEKKSLRKALGERALARFASVQLSWKEVACRYLEILTGLER